MRSPRPGRPSSPPARPATAPILAAALDGVIIIDRRARDVPQRRGRAHLRLPRRRGSRPGAGGRVPAAIAAGGPPARAARYLATGQTRILDRRIEVAAMRADGSEFPAELTVTRAGCPARPPSSGTSATSPTAWTPRRGANSLPRARAWSPRPLTPRASGCPVTCTTARSSGCVATLMDLQLAEPKWDSAPPAGAEAARRLAISVLGDARGAVQELREITAWIFPATLTQHGLAAAVRALADQLPIPVQVDIAEHRNCRVRSRSRCTSSAQKHSPTWPGTARADVRPGAGSELDGDQCTGRDPRQRGPAAPCPGPGVQRPRWPAGPYRGAERDNRSGEPSRPAGGVRAVIPLSLFLGPTAQDNRNREPSRFFF